MVAQQERKTAIIGRSLRPLLPAYPSEIRTSVFLFMNESLIDEYGYDDCNSIVIATETKLTLPSEEQKNRVILLERSINKFLRKGLHVCILCNDPDDPFFAQVLSNLNVRFFKSAQHISEIGVKRSEFETFINDYGTAFGIFSGDCGWVIATTKSAFVSALLLQEIIERNGNGKYIVGFTRKVEHGMLTFLPFFVPPGWPGLDDRKLSKMISELRRCLDTHRKNIDAEPPMWIEEIKLKMERDLESQIVESEIRIAPKKELLEKQHYFKSILWLKHDALRDCCMAVLNEMGIRTRKHDIGIEDFWILNEHSTDSCVCEARGKDGNLSKKDLLKFQVNVNATEKGEGFPSLLIANTNNKSETLKAKDERIPSNVIVHAVRNKILIMRTLDLIKLLNLFQSGKVLSHEILEQITHSYGWLKVDEKINNIRK